MATFVKGDIVVLRFPFSDLSSAKKRPAFVAARAQDDEFILCQITSQARIDSYSIALANSDFSSGNLNMTSLVKPQKIFTADKSLIEYKIGALKKNKTNEIIEEICRILKL